MITFSVETIILKWTAKQEIKWQKLYRLYTKFVRLQRWALQDIAVELSEKRGYDVIIDFASGLPTMDHIHYKVPKKVRPSSIPTTIRWLWNIPVRF